MKVWNLNKGTYFIGDPVKCFSNETWLSFKDLTKIHNAVIIKTMIHSDSGWFGVIHEDLVEVPQPREKYVKFTEHFRVKLDDAGHILLFDP